MPSAASSASPDHRLRLRLGRADHDDEFALGRPGATVMGRKRGERCRGGLLVELGQLAATAARARRPAPPRARPASRQGARAISSNTPRRRAASSASARAACPTCAAGSRRRRNGRSAGPTAPGGRAPPRARACGRIGMSSVRGRAHEFLTRIGDQRRAGVGDQRQASGPLEPFQQHRPHRARHCVRDRRMQRAGGCRASQQLGAATRVSSQKMASAPTCSTAIARRRDVAGIADGRGDDDEALDARLLAALALARLGAHAWTVFEAPTATTIGLDGTLRPGARRCAGPRPDARCLRAARSTTK